ncbi:MAG TPA: hypothetical protein VND93_22160, partial [Myxococcales bacterium]|nr:hypothetical protein [Myxococcales bacterium]
MPAPQAGQLEPIARGALASAGIRGENAGDLAKALADVTAQALAMFLSQAMVMPGIPAAAPPPPGSGSTVGPGMLVPPPAGGPVAAQLVPLAQGALSSNGIRGKNAPDLAQVIAGALAQGIQ